MGSVVTVVRSAARVIVKGVKYLGSTICRGWDAFYNWVSQPHIQRRLKIALAMGVGIAAMVPFAIATLGFGPAGIVAGSAAAAFQAAVYGGVVPAGGWFAVMTSLGMTVVPLASAVAAAGSLTCKGN